MFPSGGGLTVAYINISLSLLIVTTCICESGCEVQAPVVIFVF